MGVEAASEKGRRWYLVVCGLCIQCSYWVVFIAHWMICGLFDQVSSIDDPPFDVFHFFPEMSQL